MVEAGEIILQRRRHENLLLACGLRAFLGDQQLFFQFLAGTKRYEFDFNVFARSETGEPDHVFGQISHLFKLMGDPFL